MTVTAEARDSYVITMRSGVSERLLAMRDLAIEPLLLLRNSAETVQEIDRLLREAVLISHSLLTGLVDLLAAPREPETQLLPEPYNDCSLGFHRSSAYHGGLLWHPDQHRFQVHT